MLAAAVLGMLVFMLVKLKEKPQKQPLRIDAEENEATEKRDSGLWPMESLFAMRDYPVFHPDVNAYEAALSEVRQQEIASRPRGGTQGIHAPWTLQGPANIGARINCIAVDPTNKNIIYLGYSGGGAWKTTDGGQNWSPIFDGQSFLSVGHIAIDPDNPNNVFIGTGDPNISAYPFIGDGIWKSTDAGQHWQNIGLGDQRIIARMSVNPGHTQRIYAAAMGLPFERNNDRGFYLGNTSGNFQQSLFIADQTGIVDLVVSPQNPDIVFAAAWDRIRNNHESIVTGPNCRIWKSTNGGLTWSKLEGGLPDGEQCRIGLAIDPVNPLHVLACYEGANLDFLGLFESFDGGQNWQQNPCTGLDYGFQGGFAWYFGQIRINPFNNQDIWLLGVTSYRSLDGGQHWYEAAGFNQGIHADHHDLAFLSNQEFLLATDGGLYRSNDGGANWFRAENIPTTQFYRVAYNPHNAERYYGGAQDNGTVGGSSSTVNNWEHLFGGDGFQAAFHPTDPNIYYYEYQNGSIMGTTDGGNFFDDATSGIDGGDRRHWDMQYIISKHDPNVMYTGTQRLYQSYGHLPTWFPITDDLTDGNIFGARYHTISAINESPLDPNQVYVGTTDANVWLVDPFNQISTNITAGLPERYVTDIAASPSDPNRVFVAQSGYRDNDFSAHIHRSDDHGATWTPIGGDMPNLAVNALQILPGHQDSVIFAGTDGGVYVTTNSGGHWERLGDGMPIVPVFDLDMNLQKKTLIAGTHARSIFSFPLDSLRIGENSSTFAPGGVAPPSLSISPSLAYDKTVLSLDNLKSNQSAEVFVTDMSGKVLWQQAYKGFGKHEETFDLSHFAPGVYVAFARSNGKAWGARKFVVAR